MDVNTCVRDENGIVHLAERFPSPKTVRQGGGTSQRVGMTTCIKNFIWQTDPEWSHALVCNKSDAPPTCFLCIVDFYA